VSDRAKKNIKGRSSIPFHSMAAFASVVGMVVSIKKTKEMSRSQSLSGGKMQAFGKMIYSFPDESDCEASYEVNMLMLDG
jgi:hypothetical protein